MSRRVGLFSILVPDYDDAIDHFVNDLGFELVEDTPQPGKRWVVVRPGPNAETAIVLAEATTPEQEAAIGNQLGGRIGFFLHTDDFARDHARMTAAGVHFREAPRHEPYGTVAVFEDKYGNGWDLLEPA
jgi:catechol 2,3-dioxygenase-like lactoylglutathione lyase family enzyme